MQFDLTDDQRTIQETARRFTADRITPHAAEWDAKHHFPRDIIREVASLGFAAIYVSEANGGIGLGRLEAALVMEAMAYGCPSTSAFISSHNMAAWMIDAFGDAALQAKYLPDLVTMDIVMPTMNGIDALKQIRANDPNAKIIMCTAVGQENMVRAAIMNGAARHG